jgi:hypothetical protein
MIVRRRRASHSSACRRPESGGYQGHRARTVGFHLPRSGASLSPRERLGRRTVGWVIEEAALTTIVIRAGTTFRGMRYQHDTERDVPNDLAERMLREGSARPVPLRETDRANAATLAEAFRAMQQAAMTIEEVLRRNDRLHETVPTTWPLPMSASAFAAACHTMMEHYQALAVQPQRAAG